MSHEAEIPVLVSQETISPEQSRDAPVLGLRNVDPTILEAKLAEGALIRDIAQEYGVSRTAVSKHIARHGNRESWEQAREESIAARLEQAISDMDEADDILSLSRAREQARLWMWRAEREHPARWATRPATQLNIGGEGITVNVVSYAPHAAPLSPDVTDSTDDADSK